MIEAILRYICTISVQLLCDKVQGEGQKYDFVLYGGGGGVWRGAKLYYIMIEWPLTLKGCYKQKLVVEKMHCSGIEIVLKLISKSFQTRETKLAD